MADLEKASSHVAADFFTEAHAIEDPTREQTGPEEVELPLPAPVDDFPEGPARAAMIRSLTDRSVPTTRIQSRRSDSAPFSDTDRSLRRVSTSSTTGARPRRGTARSRTNPFVQGLKRTVTAGTTRSQPYSFVFDAMSDGSDSSSAEDEKEKPAHAKKLHKHEHETAEERIRRKEQDHDRKQMRKGLSYSQFKLSNNHLKTKGRVSGRDGRLRICVNETAKHGYLAKAFGATIKHHLDIPSRRNSGALAHRFTMEHEQDCDAQSIASDLQGTPGRPKLNIVIMVIGSRGDIQPFLKIGKILKHKYGHHVRVATHPAFREFVENDVGLEFFSVGGDPAQLMAFMVKNPGLMPSFQTVREGEIKRRRDQMAEMMDGFWRACVNATDGENDEKNKEMLNGHFPFVADAIIANPPSFAHVHIAERLGIPLHMMFTFPYSPTTQFPHPLANIRPGKSNVDTHYVNYMSYALVEMMTWQGLGDLVNDLRVKTLGLEPVSSLWAPGALNRLKVPYTYMWSPSLVPKPQDWGKEIDLAGFVFLDLASNYKPDQQLADFLDAGDAPIYIGFGSIVVDNPELFTKMIFEAVKKAGVRALINKGWGGFGGDGSDVPEGIFMINNVPHDWLFPRVKAVVHHGGAGTTAIGLKCGKPTMIVPFFGDQPFWGAMVAEKRAGAFECIPYKQLDADRMAEGIKQCLTEEAQKNVQEIADSIAAEGDGAENAVRAFHRALPLAGRHSIRCSILENRVAVWQLRNSSLRLSALAAEILIEKGKLKWHDLKLIRHCDWNDFDGPGEPISGSTAAAVAGLYSAGEGVGMVPIRIAKHIKHRHEHEKKKKAIAERREQKAALRAAAASNARPNAERTETTNTLGSTLSADPTEPMYRELQHDVTTGFGKSGFALLNLPLNAVVATAQGFHNAPRLYGDATVRRPMKITGMKSGFKAAGVETGLAVWDGCTGVVTQPMGGWSDGATYPAKVAGLSRGLAMGLGGFVLKNSYAIIAPWACFGLGTRKYFQKRGDGPGASGFLKHSRRAQGEHEAQELEQEEPDGHLQLAQMRGEVEGGWHVYEQIWSAAQVFRSKQGAKPVGKFRYEKERRLWVENGLLENVRTAREALEAKKKGQNLDGLIARRRQQLDEAEKPAETSVVDKPTKVDEQTAPSEAAAKHMPTTTKSSNLAVAHGTKDESSEQSQAHASRRPSVQHEDSDATAVDLSADEKVHKVSNTGLKSNQEADFVEKGLHDHTSLSASGMISV